MLPSDNKPNSSIFINVVSQTSSTNANSDVRIVFEECSISESVVGKENFDEDQLNCFKTNFVTSASQYFRVMCPKTDTSERVRSCRPCGDGWWSVIFIRIMCSRMRKRVVIFLAISAFLSVINTMFIYVDFSDWSLEYLILYRSVDFSFDLFVWSNEDFTNQTNELISLYGTELTPTATCLGIFRLFADYCEIFQDYCFIDIWLLITLGIWRLASKFHLPQDNGVTHDFESIWKKYKNLQQNSDMLEEGLGNFLKQVHMINLFSCTYFLLKCTDAFLAVSATMNSVNGKLTEKQTEHMRKNAKGK
ncbi:unnamed protein product [Orchesella dallaii]|uniref:Uncharacterized protein n=1 Tax=Orchesella dallaii TaxID=48710 RepID=A0ABP1S9D9_9HEXA